jgi:hypothetical protein
MMERTKETDAAIQAKLLTFAAIGNSPDARTALVEVDMEQAYPYWLALLREKHKGAKAQVTEDQYWLEVAHQCVKLDLQAAIAGTALDPRVSGKVLAFHFKRAPAFAQAGKPKGRGAEAASKGKEGRAHFALIRGKAALLAAAE